MSLFRASNETGLMANQEHADIELMEQWCGDDAACQNGYLGNSFTL
jgi:hypothetical protein